MIHGSPDLRSHHLSRVPYRTKLKNGYSLRSKVHKDTCNSILCRFFEKLGSPVALSTWLLYKNREFNQLVSRSIDPIDYIDADLFSRDYAASRFFSKCSDLETGIDTKSVAIESAQKAEAICKETNEKFRRIAEGHVSATDIVLISKVSQITSKILGPLRPGMFRDTGFSSGRTSSVSGDKLTPIHKYGARLDCTHQALQLAFGMVATSHHWGQAALKADGPTTVLPTAFNLVMGNTLICVPKNAKTDRTIAYEPHCNIRLQLSVGGYLAGRASLHGIQLDDQSINQRRARLGSLHGNLSTIDLSMASDTLSHGVVLALLPVDWFQLLDKLRSPMTLWPDGSLRENEKFSSMGNGFTFELESIIFYAICSAVSHNVSVFGDDLIVPTEDYDACISALEFFGFSPNQRKSFSQGLFRESCGADWFSGRDVTPVYLRSIPKTTEDVIKLHNQMRRWFSSNDIRVTNHAYLLWIRNVVPFHHGPSGYGDGHYHVDLDSQPRANYSIDGWWFQTACWVFPAILEGICTEFGSFQAGLSGNVLCASLGPRRAYDLKRQPSYRRYRKEHHTRVLANFHWPTVIWV